jgi:hypothetical protein
VFVYISHLLKKSATHPNAVALRYIDFLLVMSEMITLFKNSVKLERQSKRNCGRFGRF